MKLMHLILPLLLSLASGAALAAGDSGAAPHMSALEAALTECATTVKKDAEGMPDQKAMEACMKAKGFGGPEAKPTAAAKPKAK